MGRTPVARGSSVPPWPALAAPVARRTLLTTAADVIPAGLSITSHPLSALARRRSTTLTIPAFVMVPVVPYITSNHRITQDLCDAIRLLERSVEAERQVGDELQVNAFGDAPSQKRPGARQRPNHRDFLAAAEPHDEDRPLAQVGAEPDLRHGDGHRCQRRIANFPAFQDAGERVAQLLADTQPSLTNGSVISRHGGLTRGTRRCRRMLLLELPRHLLHLEALDAITDLDVLVVGKGDAALEPFPNLADVLLKVLQLGKFALVDDHVVAQQPYLAAPADDTLDHSTASDLAHLGDREDLAYFRVAEDVFAQSR